MSRRRASAVARGLGELARARGATNEEAALRAAMSAPTRIRWVTSARAATPDEDRRGIDIVVTTTLGALWLQVKSSPLAARAWAAEHAHRMIEVVVASHDPTVMNARVDGALWKLHGRIESRRAGRT